MTTIDKARWPSFIQYAATCHDEKGHAQNFLERLFQTLGFPGTREAGAILEDRIKVGKTTRFADLTWRERGVIIEMKKRGEPLAKHFPQLRDYWLDTQGWRARYLLLCNFEDLWIYDTHLYINEPIERLKVAELPQHNEAIGFLYPTPQRTTFRNNMEAVSTEIATDLANLVRRLRARGIRDTTAQRFVLQCVLCMFAEDFELLPRAFFLNLLRDCLEKPAEHNIYDLLTGLFSQMNHPRPAAAGRFRDVRYFNGGLFAQIEAIDLHKDELELLIRASERDWSQLDPAIFGTIFQHSLNEDERHQRGAHYTTEADIQKIVLPTIVLPWRERIAATNTLAGLKSLRLELNSFKVLDPACGSGNFLYVAYRELRRLELSILLKIRELFPTNKAADLRCSVSVQQCYGVEILPFAVEIAKVTLMLAKELSIREMQVALDDAQLEGADLVDPTLPLDNLDAHIVQGDALFMVWPEVDTIIGNPPFQSKNKIKAAYGANYVSRLRKKHPAIPGRADYCVYFFRLAHDHLKQGQRAGLVGTNTIRQNDSRVGGLDHIVETGIITNAVSTQDWSGDAAVHVSIVNWIKVGEDETLRSQLEGLKTLQWQDEAKHWHQAMLLTIPSSLSAQTDVTTALKLRVNQNPKTCHQGQTHGHEGFLLERKEAEKHLAKHPEDAEVLHPFLTADELFKNKDGLPDRFVIDLHPHDLFGAQQFKLLFSRIQSLVLPDRKAKALEEQEKNDAARAKNPKAKVNRHHANFLRQWWLLSYAREDLMATLSEMPRYIVCGQVTKRPIFALLHPEIHPNAGLMAFTMADDYSFGVLQSGMHWAWFVAKCSTLEERPRYTSTTVYDTFPWPQAVTLRQAHEVAAAAVALREVRESLQQAHGLSLRDLYRLMEQPGDNALKAAHARLDRAVEAAYGKPAQADVLAFLLELNHACAAKEADGEMIVGPGLPPCVTDPAPFITQDCIRFSAPPAPAVERAPLGLVAAMRARVGAKHRPLTDDVPSEWTVPRSGQLGRPLPEFD